MKTKKDKRIIFPRKNCSVCHGLGLEYFADSFDHDNGKTCWKCQEHARRFEATLVPCYTR